MDLHSRIASALCVSAWTCALASLVGCDAGTRAPFAKSPAATTKANGPTKLPIPPKPRGGAQVDLPPSATCAIGEQPPAAPFDQIPRLDKCIALVPDDWPANQLPPDAMDSALAFRDPSTGTVKPWHDGDAAVLAQGMQGTGHVQTDVMLHLPQAKGTAMTVQVVRQVWYDCGYHHESPPIPVKLVPGPTAGWWVPEKALRTIVNMPMHLACGRWVRLQIFVRLPADDHWHAAACTLKLWVAAPILGEYN